jgi:RNA polymerase sigma-70 factor (ECF subfamily)
MNSPDSSGRLSRIKTHWTLVFQAHQGQGDAVTAAYQELLLRYYGAVYRYLLGTLHDPEAAEELTQEFAVRFLRGDFQRADPQRGRFRDFLKTAVRHLALDHWERQKRQEGRYPRALTPADAEDRTAPPVGDDLDRTFVDNWRKELLARAWEALRSFQEETGQPYHTVLLLKTEHPDLHSPQFAEQLGLRLDKVFTEEGVRQLLHRARKKFADLLVAEVAHSLQTTDHAALEQELIELDLLCYCQAALERRERSG